MPAGLPERGLTREQIRHFTDEGWLMVPDVFTDAEIQPLRDEITGVIDEAARRLLVEGKVSRTFEEEPFETRLTRLYTECDEILPPIVGRAGGGHSGPAFFEFITNARLLATLESLVGPEIVGSSVYRIRPKMPSWHRGAVPWHQDSGYFSPHCDGDLIVTCWIPLVDTYPENGCLQVLPRAHRSGVVRHYTNGPGGYLVIQDEDLPAGTPEPVTVPVPAGGVLYMTNLTPHMSTPHTKDVVRWAVDVRYQSADVPNNVGELPADFTPDRPDTEIACYPPEADFVVQSRRDPAGVVGDWHAFHELRERYEHDRPPGPKRGWESAEAPA
jgi:phytanoyl-CoA hydroxylase